MRGWRVTKRLFVTQPLSGLWPRVFRRPCLAAARIIRYTTFLRLRVALKSAWNTTPQLVQVNACFSRYRTMGTNNSSEEGKDSHRMTACPHSQRVP